MKFLKIVLCVLVVATTVAACQSIDFKKTSAGIPYKIFSNGNSKDSIKLGSFVKLNVIRKTKDTVLFNSYTTKKSVFLEVAKPQTPSFYNDISSAIMEILVKAKKGDSIYLTQSSDSLLKDPQTPPGVKKGDQVITTVRVEDVFKTKEETDAAYYKEQIPSKEELAENNKMMKQNFSAYMKDSANAASLQKDDKIIEDYLKANGINARKTDWGVYVQDLTPGSGPKPSLRQYTKVNYKGMHLSGEIFDQGSIPNVQIGGQGTIPGFWLGILELQKGGKGRVYIPSLLGYGVQGSPPKIKANEPLIFEIELLDISDVPFPGQPQGQRPNN